MFDFNYLKKNLKKEKLGFRKIKLAIVSDSASQFLKSAIKGYGIEKEIDFDIYEADYNQIDLQVFDFSSELYEYEPEFIFINYSSEHLLKEFYKKTKNQQFNFSNDKITHFKKIVDTLNSKLKSKIIVNNYLEINDNVFGNFASKVEISFIYQVRKLNFQLMDFSRETKNLFVADFTSLQSQYGYHFTFDPKLYTNADIVYSIDFIPYIAKSITDIVCSISGIFKKCLILDLDNTVWGGIIGDDGIEGIQIGDLGIGKAFTELQLWAKQLKQRGIILCVCSKNTEEIAKEPFAQHPEMVLKLEDIAVFMANWDNKVDNIKYIQNVLNIGFDSMVFLDDNPFEREMVRIGISDITVPNLPEDPAEYLGYLRTLNLFETASFTDEDEIRTQQYQEEAKRNILQKSFGNEEDFLKNLNMLSDLKPFNKFTIPRVAQLTQRSNQFNLRTIRYTEEEILQIADSKEYFSLSFTLEDTFGEHGLIGIIILKNIDNESAFIDSWIMSCRVLKRGMENFTLNKIVELAKEKGFNRIIGEYIPTKKNAIVKNHYLDLGFRSEGEEWILELANFEPLKTFINTK
jgi:FkbH-like protein